MAKGKIELWKYYMTGYEAAELLGIRSHRLTVRDRLEAVGLRIVDTLEKGGKPLYIVRRDEVMALKARLEQEKRDSMLKALYGQYHFSEVTSMTQEIERLKREMADLTKQLGQKERKTK